MRAVVAALAVAVSATAFFTMSASAGGVPVRQKGPANVYAAVRVGSRPSSVEVEQQGRFNVLGVVQATPDAELSAYQRGGSNFAVVRQFGSPLPRGAMP